MQTGMNTGPRLTRSTTDRRWCGVAGGMARYLDVDPTLMRVGWVVAAVVTGGVALLIYFGLALALPRDADYQPANAVADMAQRRRFWGIVLVTLGLLLALANAGAWHWLAWAVVWPLALVFLGVVLLVRRFD